jgi:hypothetical protein
MSVRQCALSPLALRLFSISRSALPNYMTAFPASINHRAAGDQ